MKLSANEMKYIILGMKWMPLICMPHAVMDMCLVSGICVCHLEEERNSSSMWPLTVRSVDWSLWLFLCLCVTEMHWRGRAAFPCGQSHRRTHTHTCSTLWLSTLAVISWSPLDSLPDVFVSLTWCMVHTLSSSILISSLCFLVHQLLILILCLLHLFSELTLPGSALSQPAAQPPAPLSPSRLSLELLRVTLCAPSRHLQEPPPVCCGGAASMSSPPLPEDSKFSLKPFVFNSLFWCPLLGPQTSQPLSETLSIVKPSAIWSHYARKGQKSLPPTPKQSRGIKITAGKRKNMYSCCSLLSFCWTDPLILVTALGWASSALHHKSSDVTVISQSVCMSATTSASIFYHDIISVTIKWIFKTSFIFDYF